jgi:phosphate-selective porin OprO and OprP
MRKIIFSIILTMMFALVYAGGCMDAPSEEGVNVVGYLQSQFEYKFNDEDSEYSFAFNRARMGLIGIIPYDFSYYIMYEFSSFKGGPYLLDGFITYSRFAPYASVSMGQFKSPFSLELNTPCQGLHTIRRSMAVNQLVNLQRDMGLLFEGKYENLLKYALSFTNNSQFGEADNNQNKALAARAVISPVEYVSIGGSYLKSTVPPQLAGADEDERIRYAAEFEFDLSGLTLQAEYIKAEDIGSYQTGGG